jgi:hypothetical protein
VPAKDNVDSLLCGSLTAARHNHLGVRCVPIAEAQVTSFSVSFGENRRSDSVPQRPLVPTADSHSMEAGGDLRPTTVTRNYRIMAHISF